MVMRVDEDSLKMKPPYGGGRSLVRESETEALWPVSMATWGQRCCRRKPVLVLAGRKTGQVSSGQLFPGHGRAGSVRAGSRSPAFSPCQRTTSEPFSTASSTWPMTRRVALAAAEGCGTTHRAGVWRSITNRENDPGTRVPRRAPAAAGPNFAHTTYTR